MALKKLYETPAGVSGDYWTIRRINLNKDNGFTEITLRLFVSEDQYLFLKKFNNIEDNHIAEKKVVIDDIITYNYADYYVKIKALKEWKETNTLDENGQYVQIQVDGFFADAIDLI